MTVNLQKGQGTIHAMKTFYMRQSAGEQQVLDFPALLERTGTAGVVELLRIKLGFPREVFDRAAQPLLAGYAEFVQLLPAVLQSGHRQWLFVQSLDIAGRALDCRRGRILPHGAPPEVIGAQAHRWTYAVFLAALFKGLDPALSGMQVLIRCGQDDPVIWKPRSGSMRAAGAIRYQVMAQGQAAASDAACSGLAMSLFRGLVPLPVQEWLAEDAVLMCELCAFLSEGISSGTGAISALVQRAMTETGLQLPLLTGAENTLASESARTAGLQAAGTGDPDAAHPLAVGTTAAGTSPGVTVQETEYLEPVTEAGVARVPALAERFMAWLRQGIADGTLRVNTAGALVHFVEEGMLLVSPRIFRAFAQQCGGNGSAVPAGDPDIGLAVQRQVLRAGWHLRAGKGVNFLVYKFSGGDRAVSRLSGVVIRNPERFINPLPPANSRLLRQLAGAGDA